MVLSVIMDDYCKLINHKTRRLKNYWLPLFLKQTESPSYLLFLHLA